MKKKRFISGLLISSALLLVGCSENSDSPSFKQVSVKEIDQLKKNSQVNYLLVDSDSEGKFESYVDIAKEVANDNKQQLNFFNPFQPNGNDLEDRATDDHGELKGGRLYRFEDGNISDILDLSSLKNSDLKREIESFIE